MTEEDGSMTSWRNKAEVLLILVASVLVVGWSWGSATDWFGILRTVMMVLGGLVVIALVLIVAIAIISGVMGMIGKLRRKN